MIIRQTALAVALLVGAAAQAEEGIEYKFSGFGTVAATHSSIRSADYVGSRFQPNGAGATRNPDFGPDTKIGGQLSARFNEQWSGVIQVVSQHQYDNSYNPALEWANIKYQPNSDWSFRAGRIALPTYLISDSRFVGYANPWAHVPTEVYSVLAITSNDGVDLTYRKAFGEVNNTFQAYYGVSKAKLPNDAVVKSTPAWGFNDSIELGALTLRAGYSNLSLDITLPSLDGLFAGISGYAAGIAGTSPAAAAEATAMANKYKLNGMGLSAVCLGVSYDPGNWFVMSELVAFKGDGFLTNSTSWYGTAGYRFGTLTPFISYASTKAKIPVEAGITSFADGGLTAGVNATLNQFNGSQNATSVGVRWDAMRNVAVKAQYDQVKLGAGSAGRFNNPDPARFPYGGKVNLLSVSVDFVF